MPLLKVVIGQERAVFHDANFIALLAHRTLEAIFEELLVKGFCERRLAPVDEKHLVVRDFSALGQPCDRRSITRGIFSFFHV